MGAILVILLLLFFLLREKLRNNEDPSCMLGVGEVLLERLRPQHSKIS